MDDSASSREMDPPPELGFKKVVFCSGKIYFELSAERAKLGLQVK
jgi:2-oxoglutarate dehydrogenase complex dehydrogenase (E1) component-like enzyme